MSPLVSVVLLTGLFLVSVVYTFKNKDVLNPLLIFLTPITLGHWLYFLFLSDSYTLNPKTTFMLNFSVISFMVGYFWVVILPRIKSKRSPETNINLAFQSFEKVKKPFFLIGVIGFILGLIYAYKHGMSGPANFLYNLRYTTTVDQMSYGVVPYLLLFLHIVLLISVCGRKQEFSFGKKKILAMYVMLIASSFFTMSRTTLVMFVISCVGAYLFSSKYIYKEKKVNYKLLFSSLAFFISLSWIVADATNKVNLRGSNFLFSYLANPIIAFDSWVYESPIDTKGSQTFAPLFKILSALGVNTPSSEIHLGLNNGDFNVFTFMKDPYMDFGEIGLYAYCLALGIFIGIMYKKARAGNPYWVVLYSLFLYPLLMSFYANQFNLSSLVYYMIILFFVYFLEKLKTNKQTEVSGFA